MFLNVPKFREYLEERINWYTYGEENKTKTNYYGPILEASKKFKFVEDALASIHTNDTFVEDIKEAYEDLIKRIGEGEFDMFEEKERE